MSDFFDQLVQRSLDTPPAGFQPRLLSRYEEAQPVSRDDAQPDSTPMTLTKPVSPATELRRSPSRTVAPVGTPSPAESVNQEHHHHHHERTIVEQRLLSIAPSEELRIVHAGEDQRLRQNRPQPPRVAAPLSLSDERVPPAQHEPAAQKEVLRKPGSVFPPVFDVECAQPAIGQGESPAYQAPRAEAVLNQPAESALRPSAPTPPFPTPIVPTSHPPKAPPRIIAEPVRSSEREQHTVTVTIGRIEVHGPQPKATPPGKPAHPAPRVMTLDDYARRRTGGAG